MSPRRFWLVTLVLTALVAAGVPFTPAAAEGAAPKSLNFDEKLSAPALDMDVDAAGKYAVVAVEPIQLSSTPLPHLYVYDLQNPGRVGTARYPTALDEVGADINRAAVDVAPNTNGASHYAVGVRYYATLYDLNNNQPQRAHAFDTDGRVTDVAITPTADRLVAGVAYSTDQRETGDLAGSPILGQVTVFDTRLAATGTSMNAMWTHTYPSAVTAVALRGDTLAVATEYGLFVYDGLDVSSSGTIYNGTDRCTASISCQHRDMREGVTGTDNVVRHLAFSKDGNYLVAGTDNGDILLLATSNVASPRMSAGFSGNGALRGVVMNDAGTLFAGVWNDGTLRVYEHDRIATSVYTKLKYKTDPVGGTPKWLSMSASGEFLLVTTGSKALAFTSDRQTVQWSIDTVDQETILKAQFTPDGRRIAVARSGSFQAYEQITKVTIIPDRYYDPSVGAEVPNVGQLAAPGARVNYAFTLRNDGTTDDAYDFSMLKPLGGDWQVYMPDPVDLRPGQEQRVNLEVVVPGSTQPGEYDFTVGVTSERLQTDAASITLYANVTHLAQVVLTPGPGQDRNVSLQADQDTEFTMTLRNVGNAEAVVNLSITDQTPSGSGAIWNVTLDRDQNIRIGGGDEVLITGTMRAPLSAKDGERTILRVQPEINESAAGHPLELTFILNPRYGVTLTTEEPHVQVPGGERTPILVTVRNTGNTRATVQFCFNLTTSTGATGINTPCQVITTNDWKVEATQTDVEIGEGGRTATYTLFVQPKSEFPEIESITIEAVVVETRGTGDLKTDTLTIGIERVPEDRTPEEGFFTRLLPGPGAAASIGMIALVAFAVARLGAGPRPPRTR